VIVNSTTQIGVTPSPHFSLIQDLRFQVREIVIRSFPREYVHFDYRWYPEYLGRSSGQYVYEVGISAIAGYSDSIHCLEPGDLLYWEDMPLDRTLLKFVDPSPAQRIPVSNAPPHPRECLGKTKTFVRKQFVIPIPTVKLTPDRTPLILSDYWELQ
jgi:hypothetical protein